MMNDLFQHWFKLQRLIFPCFLIMVPSFSVRAIFDVSHDSSYIGQCSVICFEIRAGFDQDGSLQLLFWTPMQLSRVSRNEVSLLRPHIVHSACFLVVISLFTLCLSESFKLPAFLVMVWRWVVIVERWFQLTKNIHWIKVDTLPIPLQRYYEQFRGTQFNTCNEGNTPLWI